MTATGRQDFADGRMNDSRPHDAAIPPLRCPSVSPFIHDDCSVAILVLPSWNVAIFVHRHSSCIQKPV